MPSVHKHSTFRTSSVTVWITFANIVHLFGRQLRTRVAGPSEAPVAPSPAQTFRRTIRAVASARGPSWLIQETPSHWSSLNSRWTANSTLQKLRDPIHQQYGEYDIGLWRLTGIVYSAFCGQLLLQGFCESKKKKVLNQSKTSSIHQVMALNVVPCSVFLSSFSIQTSKQV